MYEVCRGLALTGFTRAEAPTGLVPVERRFLPYEPASHRDKPGGDVPGANPANRKRQ